MNFTVKFKFMYCKCIPNLWIPVRNNVNRANNGILIALENPNIIPDIQIIKSVICRISFKWLSRFYIYVTLTIIIVVLYTYLQQ